MRPPYIHMVPHLVMRLTADATAPFPAARSAPVPADGPSSAFLSRLARSLSRFFTWLWMWIGGGEPEPPRPGSVRPRPAPDLALDVELAVEPSSPFTGIFKTGATGWARYRTGGTRESDRRHLVTMEITFDRGDSVPTRPLILAAHPDPFPGSGMLSRTLIHPPPPAAHCPYDTPASLCLRDLSRQDGQGHKIGLPRAPRTITMIPRGYLLALPEIPTLRELEGLMPGIPLYDVFGHDEGLAPAKLGSLITRACVPLRSSDSMA